MINNVVLVGRITKELDLRYTPAGKAVARFNLAVNRDFKDANGEQQADFPNCQVWGKTADPDRQLRKRWSADIHDRCRR